jgi:hypothetical protein
MATVRELRSSLMQVPEAEADSEVKVWLPGSRITLSAALMRVQGQWLIEGNVDAGSALGTDPSRVHHPNLAQPDPWRRPDHSYQPGALGICQRCGGGH